MRVDKLPSIVVVVLIIVSFIEDLTSLSTIITTANAIVYNPHYNKS